MKSKRTKLEMLLRKVANVCGVSFRFHRLKKIRYPDFWVCLPNNHPREWSFEWWRRDDELLNVVNMNGMKSCKTKDEAIEYVLFNTDFAKSMFGHRISSYEELFCDLDLRCIDYDRQ